MLLHSLWPIRSTSLEQMLFRLKDEDFAKYELEEQLSPSSYKMYSHEGMTHILLCEKRDELLHCVYNEEGSCIMFEKLPYTPEPPGEFPPVGEER